MASCKRIFALLVMIKLFASSSAASLGGNKQIYPVGTIRVLHGRGTFRAGPAGVTCPNEIDHLCRIFPVTIMEHRRGYLPHEDTFTTPNNEIITQVHVRDMQVLPTPGGTIELVNGGPGSPSVTLKFTSAWNSAIHKFVDLYCRDHPHQA